MAEQGATAEHARLTAKERDSWLRWGPYLSERAWGTVREDYSHDGTVWSHFTHDHARSRAYRWNEDGLAGLCDIDQNLCLAFSFWNGRDPILKERIFGLNGHEGNHGEDAKELWWYLDATPSASYLEWAYVYPQNEFPYSDLIAQNGRRSRHDREYEIEDTGVFDDGRFWDINVTYAKRDAEVIVARVSFTNAGPDPATLHVLPTLWFRNTWSHRTGATKPQITSRSGGLAATDESGHHVTLIGGGQPVPLFCDNETNQSRLQHGLASPPFPKDGINDHVLWDTDTVNPQQTGTKAALWYEVEVEPGATSYIELLLDTSDGHRDVEPAGPDLVDDTIASRLAEATEFYEFVIPPEVTADDRAIARAAFAGMIWGKQFYAYNVEDWLEGDPDLTPPAADRKHIRNTDWRHHFAADIISMPDPWEYPWYAAWDLAFHSIPFAHIDPQFAKEQLLLLCEDRYSHPNGQLPAYEWSFGDVNPPVHAMAALQVYKIDDSTDLAFLIRIFNRLLLNFSWWVNRKDLDDNNVFQGGFLGLDNIGPFDRSDGLPDGWYLDQADGTGWMASYALHMLEIALELSSNDPVYDDMAKKFFDHFAYIATAMDARGLWDDDAGFYYDVLHGPDSCEPLRVHSMVGLLPLCATGSVATSRFLEPTAFAGHVDWFMKERREFAENIIGEEIDSDEKTVLLAVADLDRLRRVLKVMLDPAEFLSAHGIRSLAASHRDQPFEVTIGSNRAAVGYEPAESQTALFGGNSNWRGPVWFPVNHLMIGALRRYALHTGDSFTVEYPTGSGKMATLAAIADDLSSRLVSLFRARPDGTIPFTGVSGQEWSGRLLFHEYFDGDTGRGLGASHQTGWTGLIADLIIRREATEQGFAAHELRRVLVSQNELDSVLAAYGT